MANTVLCCGKHEKVAGGLLPTVNMFLVILGSLVNNAMDHTPESRHKKKIFTSFCCTLIIIE